MRLTLSVLLTVVTMQLAAQGSPDPVVLRGTVADNATKAGEPYATIRVVSKSDTTKTLKMIAANKDGIYHATLNGRGTFLLTVTSMGRKSELRQFEVRRGEREVMLDTIFVSDEPSALKGVEVVAQKPLVKSDIDKITYSIEDDPDSKTNSILEMLRKVPLVNVDAKENIQVNGSSKFKVYQNGKPNNMMTDNPKEVLRSIPASTIKHIEVITDPGPKYDAEGIGGILNIVTIGGGMEGYTATFNTAVSNRGLGVGAYAITKNEKLTVSGRYSYWHNLSRRDEAEQTTVTTGDITEASSDSKVDICMNNLSNWHNGSVEVSYEIDSLNLLTGEVGMNIGGNRQDIEQSFNATSPLTGSTLYEFKGAYKTRSTKRSINVGADYQRLFKRKNRIFTMSYRLSTSPRKSDNSAEYTDISYDDSWSDFVRNINDQNILGDVNSTEHTLQADYTTPIGKLHTIETGLKYILRDNRSDMDQYVRNVMAGDEDFVFDNENSSHYKHRNDIFAAYFGYSLKLKKLTTKAGLRYEHTLQEVEQTLGKGEDFSKRFNDVVPSVNFGWKIDNKRNVRLGYSMRIYRPGINHLSPYMNVTDPRNIRQGNTNLESEKKHTIDLRYGSFSQKLNINVSLYCTFLNNSIEGVTELVNDRKLIDKGLETATGKDVLYTTYINAGRQTDGKLNAYINWNPTSTTRLTSTVNVKYIHMDNRQGLRNHGWTAWMNLGIQQSFKHDWMVSGHFYSNTPNISLQGRSRSNTMYSIRIQKSFLKKRLTLALHATNFFSKYMDYEYKTTGKNYVSTTRQKYEIWQLGIGANLRIGELKASVRKAKRGVTNDDVKSSGEENKQ